MREKLIRERPNYSFVRSDSHERNIELFKISKVLQMTDVEWATGRLQVEQRTAGPYQPQGASPQSYNRLPRLYRTAHLIIYYYIQIEGERAVTKIRKFIDENHQLLTHYKKHEVAYRDYQMAIDAFLKLPGVIRLADGRVQYPSDLKMPVPPVPPFTDPNLVKLGGRSDLLGDESAEVVGARIEEAVVRDIKVEI